MKNSSPDSTSPATSPDNFMSRITRRVIRFLLQASAVLAVWGGFTLLFSLFPGVSLVAEKIISGMGGVVVSIAGALGLILAGSWLRRMLMRWRQAQHDRTAQRIMEALRADPEAPVGEFYLYLRAFETTGKLPVPLYLRLRKLGYGLNKYVTNDIESHVSDAVRKLAPMIALGQPGEAIGAGRIDTEDAHWMEDIIVLMKRARAILLVPSSQPGTLWEIESLKREGLLGKVIFIMPPRTKGDFDTLGRWEAARQAMVELGLEAPDHQDRGLLFKVGNDGRVANVESMLLGSHRQVRKSLRRLLTGIPPKGGLYAAVALADKRTRRTTFWGWVETLRQLSPYALAAMAPFVTHPDLGFDPKEPWPLVLDREGTYKRLSDYELTETLLLGASEKYRALITQTPPERLGGLNQELQLSGLVRLGNDNAKAFYAALGSMLGRLDTKRCAAFARGEMEAAERDVVLSYIPRDQIDRFLAARTSAILAEAEEAPIPPLDTEAVAQATEQFLDALGPEGRQRYERVAASQERLSDEDQCWAARVLFGSVATLAEPHGGVWARTIAAMAISAGESTGVDETQQEVAR